MSSTTSTVSDGGGVGPHSIDFLNDPNIESSSTGNEFIIPTMDERASSTAGAEGRGGGILKSTETSSRHHSNNNSTKPVSTVPIMVEKKRDREKKRRTDITNAIDALVQLLVQIDPSLIMVRNNQVFGILSSTGALLPMNEPSIYHLQVPPTSTSSSTTMMMTNDLETNADANAQQQQQQKETDAFIGMKRRYRTSLVGDPVPLNRTDIIHHAARVLAKIHKENEEHRKEIQQLKFLIAQQSVCFYFYYYFLYSTTWLYPVYVADYNHFFCLDNFE